MVFEDLVNSSKLIDIGPTLDFFVYYAVVELSVFEHAGKVIFASFRHPCRQLLHGVFGDHKKMLEVVMGGKEQVACIQFWDDTAN
jgi:hypothetical protein